MKFVPGDKTVLWDLTELQSGGYPRILMNTLVHRIYRKAGGRHRVILHALYMKDMENLFINGDKIRHLAIHHPEGPFDKYNPDECIIAMGDCELSREWIPKPVATYWQTRGEDIRIYIELKCTVTIKDAA